MGRLFLAAGLLGAGFAGPALAADPQNAGIPTRMTMSIPQQPESRAEPLRIDIHRFADEEAARKLELPGVPFLSTGNAGKRERGFSFSVRPVKGVRAIARFRF